MWAYLPILQMLRPWSPLQRLIRTKGTSQHSHWEEQCRSLGLADLLSSIYLTPGYLGGEGHSCSQGKRQASGEAHSPGALCLPDWGFGGAPPFRCPCVLGPAPLSMRIMRDPRPPQESSAANPSECQTEGGWRVFLLRALRGFLVRKTI